MKFKVNNPSLFLLIQAPLALLLHLMSGNRGCGRSTFLSLLVLTCTNVVAPAHRIASSPRPLLPNQAFAPISFMTKTLLCSMSSTTQFRLSRQAEVVLYKCRKIFSISSILEFSLVYIT